MRNIKVIGYRLWVIGVLMGALMVSAPTKAQFSNQDMFNAQAPSTTFQSTSTMMSSGSEYSSNPTIGDNGTAVAPSSRIRTIGQRRNDVGDDEDNPNPDDIGNPIGDVVLPLLALAMVYGVWCMVYRRKRRA